MKFKVTLSNTGGEIDSETFEVAADHPDQDEAVNIAASEIIYGWVLSSGDTITISEV